MFLFSPLYVLSWEVMTRCWCTQSLQRPKFTDFVKTFSDLLETNSSYLKLNG